MNPQYDIYGSIHKGLRAGAPAAPFDGLLGSIRPLLGARDWRKPSVALGL